MKADGQADLLHRITIEPGKCGGQPCIRGRRIRVTGSVKFLIDNQLPEALARHLRAHGLDAAHVIE